MFRNANNNFFAFVCNHTATDVNAIAGTSLEVADLADGDVVLVDKNNNILADSSGSATGAGSTFKIATRAGGKLFYSPLVTYADCTVTTANRAAAVQQVTTIGSNATTTNFLLPDATSNTLAVAEVGNSFYCLIEKQDNDEANRSGYHPAITAQVKLKHPSTGSLDTIGTVNVQLAEQLREAIRVNDQLEAAVPAVAGPKYVSAKVNIAGMGSNDASLYSSSPGTATCTFGSKTVTLSTASNLESEITNATGGGIYLLIGGDIYLMAAYSGTTITLEHPFAGTTGTYTSSATQSATTIGSLSNADIDAVTGVGVELTGVAQHQFDVNRHRSFSVSRFNARFAKDGENVGAAITLSTAPSEGLGEYQQVAFEEYESFGALGQRWVSDTPASFKDANTETDSVYGLISLREVTTKQNALIGQVLGKTTYHLWIELEGGVVDGANTAQDVLLTQLNISASDVQ